MISPGFRSLISRIATTTVMLASGGCAVAPTGSGLERPMPLSLAIDFSNESRERIDVYLINDQRQWLLGLVEPGATEKLKIPEGAIVANRSFVRLAVISGEPMTLRAAEHPRASVTIAQPVLGILRQQWSWSAARELMSLPARAPRGGRGGSTY